MDWLLLCNVFSVKIWTHIDMLHHQETNVLKAGGHSSQGKDRTGGGIFFQDLVSRNEFDSTDNFQAEALWFAFSGLLQEELEFVKEHWNTHKIRKNRYVTVSGRPDTLYYLPESFGGTSDLLNYVADRDYCYALEHIVGTENENVYSKYFQYVMSELNVTYPNT